MNALLKEIIYFLRLIYCSWKTLVSASPQDPELGVNAHLQSILPSLAISLTY